MELLAISGVFILGYIWARSREAEDWNGGVCKLSGKPWRYFDTASDGSRGYRDGEGNYTWISYNVDK